MTITHRAHKRIGTYTLMEQIERLILDKRITSPAFPEVAVIFVAQAFPYSCEIPRDPWDRSPHALGFRDRVVGEAAKLGIVVEWYE